MSCLVSEQKRPTNCKKKLRKKQKRENVSRKRARNSTQSKDMEEQTNRLTSVSKGFSSTPDLTSSFTDQCAVSDSDSGSETSDECPLHGLTFLEDYSCAIIRRSCNTP